MDILLTKVTRTAAEAAKGLLLSVENWKQSPIIENMDQENNFLVEKRVFMNDINSNNSSNNVRHLIPDTTLYDNIFNSNSNACTDEGFGAEILNQSTQNVINCDYCDFHSYEMHDMLRHMNRHRVLY